MKERENSVVVNNEHKQLKVHSLRFNKTKLMINDEYELTQEGNDYYIVRKKTRYPKTYEESCEIVRDDNNSFYNQYKMNLDNKIYALKKLIECRDAYWKIAGEEMGLGKPWEPDWSIYRHKFCIGTDKGIIIDECVTTGKRILAFPTAEMRNAFYKNFKDLIEQCNELL